MIKLIILFAPINRKLRYFYQVSALNSNFPPTREFVTIESQKQSETEVISNLRILQFNMLADGLSGLRSDLGAFSRAKSEYVNWNDRKAKLLYEILQYDPDVSLFRIIAICK